jgi:hypothetical protein
MKFRKKPIVVKAEQWFANGDHSEDYIRDIVDASSGRIISAAERREKNWEGDVVRYFRHPDISDESQCPHCHCIMHDHGWIDTHHGGRTVCPGDWIIDEWVATGALEEMKGGFYPCKSDIFEATYEQAE